MPGRGNRARDTHTHSLTRLLACFVSTFCGGCALHCMMHIPLEWPVWLLEITRDIPRWCSLTTDTNDERVARVHSGFLLAAVHLLMEAEFVSSSNRQPQTNNHHVNIFFQRIPAKTTVLARERFDSPGDSPVFVKMFLYFPGAST